MADRFQESQRPHREGHQSAYAEANDGDVRHHGTRMMLAIADCIHLGSHPRVCAGPVVDATRWYIGCWLASRQCCCDESPNKRSDDLSGPKWASKRAALVDLAH